MTGVYHAFRDELLMLNNEALASADQNLESAVWVQLEEVGAAEQTRTDRDLALQQSRHAYSVAATEVVSAGEASGTMVVPFFTGPSCIICGCNAAYSGPSNEDRVTLCELGCGHMVCSGCLEQMAELAATERTYCMYMRCPEVDCREFIAPGKLSDLGISTTLQMRLHEVHANRKASVSFIRSMVGGAEDIGGDDALEMLARANGWVCCQCGFVIERSSGCNHMSCHCGRHFCYMCNKELDSGSKYTCTEHVNSAPGPPAALAAPPPARNPAPPLARHYPLHNGCPICGRWKRSKSSRLITNMEHHIRVVHG